MYNLTTLRTPLSRCSITPQPTPTLEGLVFLVASLAITLVIIVKDLVLRGVNINIVVGTLEDS
jgi:hypothetical protein